MLIFFINGSINLIDSILYMSEEYYNAHQLNLEPPAIDYLYFDTTILNDYNLQKELIFVAPNTFAHLAQIDTFWIDYNLSPPQAVIRFERVSVLDVIENLNMEFSIPISNMDSYLEFDSNGAYNSALSGDNHLLEIKVIDQLDSVNEFKFLSNGRRSLTGNILVEDHDLKKLAFNINLNEISEINFTGNKSISLKNYFLPIKKVQVTFKNDTILFPISIEYQVVVWFMNNFTGEINILNEIHQTYNAGVVFESGQFTTDFAGGVEWGDKTLTDSSVGNLSFSYLVISNLNIGGGENYLTHLARWEIAAGNSSFDPNQVYFSEDYYHTVLYKPFSPGWEFITFDIFEIHE